MNAALYNPFVEATRSVFELMLDLTEIQDKNASEFRADRTLNISIGIIGDLKGEVIYRFPEATSLKFVNILSGMELNSVDDFVTSAISEIANIISGNVLTMLADDEYKCDILPPKAAEMPNPDDYAMKNSVCLCTAAGDVCLEIFLNPAK